MTTNTVELLESFQKELYNGGTFCWDDKNGTRARILTAMQKMLKAGMPDIEVKNVVLELETAFYVEHERQVKAKTGLSVREFMQKKLNDLGPLPSVELPQENKNHESNCAIVGQS